MKATFVREPKGLNLSHRKEKHFSEEFTAICFNGQNAYPAVTLRIYRTDTLCYACIWTHGNYAWGCTDGKFWANGSGRVGGYGYHKASAAASEAIRNAGIDLDEEIGGRGDCAILEAVEAIAIAICPENVFVHVTHAHA